MKLVEGCLAGPVVSAAVIFKKGINLKVLKRFEANKIQK